jgi:hypothetical protein
LVSDECRNLLEGSNDVCGVRTLAREAVHDNAVLSDNLGSSFCNVPLPIK